MDAMNAASPITPPDPWTRAVRWTAGAAALALVFEFGFRQPIVPLAVLVGAQALALLTYVAAGVRDVIRATDRRRAVGRRALDLVLLVGAVVYVLLELEFSRRRVLHASTVYIAALNTVLAVRLGVAAARYNLELSRSRLHPARLLALSFLGLILIGGLLLSLPAATRPHVVADPDWTLPRHVLNGLFTATSATCVTGLVVYDTGTDYTRAGQIVILAMIQLGGLGIMIFGSVLGLLAGRQLSLRQSLLMQDATSHETLGDLRALVLFIVAATLAFETIGAIVLYPMWDARVASVGDRVFYSVFHAVSAFCNAGFALQSDSLISYRTSWQVYGCIAPLIVLGGLGFPVLFDLWGWTRDRAARRWHRFRDTSPETPLPRKRIGLHAKMVLSITAMLIVGGTIGFALIPGFGTPSPASIVHGADPGVRPVPAPSAPRLLGALFESITCRTAGFNTLPHDVDAMSPGAHLLGAILMFIGGSPASTAGGVKTAALGVFILAVWATIRGRRNVEAFGRTIPERVVRRAGVIIVMMLTLCGVVSLALCVLEGTTLREAMFEAVSACGTVGLSTGLTPHLSVAGRLVVMIAMFAGRLGPLTIMVALAGTTLRADYEYPEETVVIG